MCMQVRRQEEPRIFAENHRCFGIWVASILHRRRLRYRHTVNPLLKYQSNYQWHYITPLQEQITNHFCHPLSGRKVAKTR